MSANDWVTETVVRSTMRCRRASVQITAGRDLGLRHDFDGRVRIGARPLADLVLQDPKISGLHCEITVAERLVVRDLGSKNGIFLGGFRVMEAVVPSGETIVLGDTRLRVTAIDEVIEVPLHAGDQFHGLVGRSAAMRALTARVERLAVSDATVLIQGETGTGKERVAEALHLAGPRAGGPLIIIDCGSLPANLIEDQIFGHERGAFTGAVSSVAGACERANGGTLFLDEIGELPLDLQPKLLRVLESREVRRLGGARSVPFDVRVVAASNRDLAIEVSKGRFREDLYYRLAVVTLQVPPLRERLDDIPQLAVYLLSEIGVDPASYLTVESLAALANHEWPGNVRELRNALERSAALAEPIAPEHLPPSTASEAPAAPTPSPGVDLAQPLRVAKQRVVEEFERSYVRAMLAECGGNVSETARRSGMDRMSIHRIIQRLGLRAPGSAR